MYSYYYYGASICQSPPTFRRATFVIGWFAHSCRYQPSMGRTGSAFWYDLLCHRILSGIGTTTERYNDKVPYVAPLERIGGGSRVVRKCARNARENGHQKVPCNTVGRTKFPPGYHVLVSTLNMCLGGPFRLASGHLHNNVGEANGGILGCEL